MKISVVVPAFNEEENILPLCARLEAALGAVDHEIVFVNDGSTDGTLERVRHAAAANPRIRWIDFSRNFGHEAASTAGIDHARGDAVILIDADLQDPPELIGEMIAKWREGADVVYARRTRREGEGVLRRVCAAAFYRVLGRVSDTPIPRDTGDFRLMDRRVVEVLKRCRENPRLVRGLCSWAGFRQVEIGFERSARRAGKSKYGALKLIALAIDSLCAFSKAPLRLAIWLGLAATALAVLLLGAVVVERLFLDSEAPRGYAFLACIVLFMGGVQLTMLGVVGQYIGAIFTNVQGRPMYVVREFGGGEAAPPQVEIKPGVRAGAPIEAARG